MPLRMRGATRIGPLAIGCPVVLRRTAWRLPGACGPRGMRGAARQRLLGRVQQAVLREEHGGLCVASVDELRKTRKAGFGLSSVI